MLKARRGKKFFFIQWTVSIKHCVRFWSLSSRYLKFRWRDNTFRTNIKLCGLPSSISSLRLFSQSTTGFSYLDESLIHVCLSLWMIKSSNGKTRFFLLLVVVFCHHTPITSAWRTESVKRNIPFATFFGLMVFHYQKFNILDYIQYHLGSTIFGLNEREREKLPLLISEHPLPMRWPRAWV